VRFENLKRTMSNLENLYSLIKEEPLECPWRSYSHYLDPWYESKASRDCHNAGVELVDNNAVLLRLKRASIERTKRVALWFKSTHMTTNFTTLERLSQIRPPHNKIRTGTSVLDAYPDVHEESQQIGGSG
jgi:hypothetical protein